MVFRGGKGASDGARGEEPPGGAPPLLPQEGAGRPGRDLGLLRAFLEESAREQDRALPSEHVGGEADRNPPLAHPTREDDEPFVGAMGSVRHELAAYAMQEQLGRDPAGRVASQIPTDPTSAGPQIVPERVRHRGMHRDPPRRAAERGVDADAEAAAFEVDVLDPKAYPVAATEPVEQPEQADQAEMSVPSGHLEQDRGLSIAEPADPLRRSTGRAARPFEDPVPMKSGKVGEHGHGSRHVAEDAAQAPGFPYGPSSGFPSEAQIV